MTQQSIIAPGGSRVTIAVPASSVSGSGPGVVTKNQVSNPHKLAGLAISAQTPVNQRHHRMLWGLLWEFSSLH
jgi:hypothetical protein